MGSVFPVCVGVAADLVFYFQYGGGVTPRLRQKGATLASVELELEAAFEEGWRCYQQLQAR